jgi:hypothetical protein
MRIEHAAIPDGDVFPMRQNGPTLNILSKTGERMNDAVS